MKIRPTKTADIPAIMGIVKDAQELLASLNIDQWQDGYPDVAQIELDIEHADSYVVENEQGGIIGTTVFCTTGEPTYDYIKGAWKTAQETPFGVIHRVAVKKEHRKAGVAQFIFDHFEHELILQGFTTMRIDTHEDNKGMQRLLAHRGYLHCGTIYIENGESRLAYEKILI